VTAQRRSEREFQEQAEKLQLGKVELEHSYRELNEINRQLESRTQELDRLNQELRRLDEMKSDLIGNVSHELQTPLVSIRGYTEMILKERLGPVSDEQRKGLNLSLRNIDRLIAMIDNLAAIARTDPDLRETTLSRFPLRPLIEEALALLEEPIAKKTLEVEVLLEDDEYVLRADRDKILQVYLNLLSNAVKFSHPGGGVEITARPGEAGQLISVVRDHGVGIPPESLGRVFERHYQVRPTSGGHPDGSGIGLSIVRDILRLHGCTIDVESEEGQGSEFKFSLPLDRDEETGDDKADEPVEPVEPVEEENRAGDVTPSLRDAEHPEGAPREAEPAKTAPTAGAPSERTPLESTPPKSAPLEGAPPKAGRPSVVRRSGTPPEATSPDSAPPEIEPPETPSPEPARPTVVRRNGVRPHATPPDAPPTTGAPDSESPPVDGPEPRPRLRIIRRYKSNG
jgi:signal transduction histidine kinase